MSTLNFNKVSIVESLNDSDQKTGQQLAHDLELLEIFHDKGIAVECIQISKPEELLLHIQSLTNDAECHGIYPVLQIEAHGSEDKKSLVLTDGSIRWDELEPYFRELNLATKCNLLIVMATCFGIHSSSIISLLDRAPFWGVIGPEYKISSPVILSSLTKLYTALYTEQNLLDALKLSPDEAELKFITCEWFFVSAYKYYVNNLCNDQALRLRAKSFKKQLRLQGASKLPSDDEIINAFKPNGKEEFQSWLHSFFMIDLFPENINKISINYEKI
ncbi:MAG TPA: hypothetical protein ENJ36_02530, partial [Candidatus Bathyarchaeota archaeon]|nr:hypothetical protein [Candidatus Bathyarchaeota archaeon]